MADITTICYKHAIHLTTNSVIYHISKISHFPEERYLKAYNSAHIIVEIGHPDTEFAEEKLVIPLNSISYVLSYEISEEDYNSEARKFWIREAPDRHKDAR